VLLDQKRTRRIVQVVAILTSIAFVGVIFVVLGLVLVGGGNGAGSGANAELVAEAQDAVDENPNDAEAWEDLAQAHSANGSPEEAIVAAEKAVELAPDELRRTQTLVALHISQNDQASAVDALTAFTKENPDNADGFLQLGTIAEQAGRTQLARISYQRYITLNPDDPTTESIEARLEELAASGGG
jgi:cytochrome c-type biogenesis protein CcmH/NrfG